MDHAHPYAYLSCKFNEDRSSAFWDISVSKVTIKHKNKESIITEALRHDTATLNKVSPWRDVTLLARSVLPLVSYIAPRSVTDADRRQRQTHGERNNTSPLQYCVGGPVITSNCENQTKWPNSHITAEMAVGVV